MTAVVENLVHLIKDESGSQVVEYGLIIAVISIALVVALGDATTGLVNSFSVLVNRIITCFTAGSTCT
ncbi:Flp family type IVb pilin [Collimonas antrihumi]|uniref:Flp family type IVb pilin n=1 Tax=Collimonas antrihumi TaxID=1940615 RepID=UPI001B8B5FD3|nr:Flp family type IVb pilin [Collimonas antrihumi]